MWVNWIDVIDSNVVETEEDILTFEVGDDTLEPAAVVVQVG